MKKFLTIISATAMAALFALALAGCGGEQSTTSYKIATDTTFAPFEYQNSNGDYEGIDVDILAAVAEDQGFTYELEPLGFDAALQAVQSGQDDAVIAGMSITDERKETFDFSDAYYDSTVCCAVSSKNKATSLKDLKGKKVATKTGTMSAKWAESIADEYDFEVTTFDTSDVMYQDVTAGNSVACFEDTPVMSYAISTGSIDLKIIDTVKEDSEFATPYGFAVKKGENAELVEKFNAGLANIKANGKYDEIVKKYVQS